jgi:hypothetical protein
MLNRACILFCCCFVFGCGGPKPYDVQAVITLDDKPLAEASVSLVAVRENATVKPATGTTDEEGNVTFKTEEKDGVLSGSYIVIISKKVEEKMLTNNEIRALAEAGIPYRANFIELVPEKYTRRETSDLKVKVGYWYTTNLTYNLRSIPPKP